MKVHFGCVKKKKKKALFQVLSLIPLFNKGRKNTSDNIKTNKM